MTVVKRRIIEPISDRAPSDADSLLKAMQREVWPFLQQVRRLLNATARDEPVTDDHKVAVDALDVDTADYLAGKLMDGDGLTWTVDTTGGIRRMKGTVGDAQREVPYDFVAYAPGIRASGAEMDAITILRDCSIAQNFDGCAAVARGGTATATTVLSIKRSRAGAVTTLGTITFAEAAVAGTFSATDAAIDLQTGDVLSIYNAALADATLAGVAVGFKATRLGYVASSSSAHAASHTIGSDQIADATPTTHGLESAADKSKLDGVAAGATVGADWNTNVANKPALGTAASHAATDFDASGAAATVQSNLNTHTSATGTAVHGLGSAATHAASDFDSSGAAAGVQTNLTTHAAATGTAVHGLGSAATHAATDFDAAGAAAAAQAAAQAASLPLHGTADAVAGATFTKNLTVDTGNVTIHGDAAGSALTVGTTASVSGTNTGDETHSTVMTKVADPAPSGKFLRDDGTYQTIAGGSADIFDIMLWS